MSDGKSAAADNANWLCVRERETFRAQVLAAAQEVMERDGPEAVTLGAVARQTKIPRATVYSLFTNRKALLSQLVSSLRTVEPAVVEPAAPENLPAPQAEEHPEAENPGEPYASDTDCVVLEATPADEVTENRELPQAEEGTTDTHAAYDKLMREQADVLQELTKQVIVPKPRERTDALVTRLDARLTVTEQSLAALEQRVGERLKSLTAETSSLNETLQGLRMRLHKFEERQMAALAQLKLEVHRLGKGEAPMPLPLPLPDPEPIVPDEPVAEEAEAADVPKMPTYLTSARLAAIHAAARATAMPPPQPKPPVRRFFRRNRWLLVAVGAVLVVWFDVYVFAHYQPAQGAAPQDQTQIVRPRPANARTAWSPRVQLVRGLKYLNGTGVPVDIDRARLWLERAALRGQPVAQNLMGVMYQTGTGAPLDIGAAIRWYEASAAQGNLKAMTNLGKVYAGGWKEGTDYVKAVEWFAKAAAYGEVDAQFDLAVLYERGEGVSRNLVQAYKWYMIAGKSGDHHAAIRATTLASQIDPDALQAADDAIASYTPMHTDAAANDVPTVSG